MDNKWSPTLNRREFLKLLGVGVGLTATGGLLQACAPSAPTASGTLSIYSALNESTNNQLFAAFKTANPGIEVQVLPLAAAGELQTRIQTEKASPKGDIFVGGDRAFHDGLGKQGLLEKYVSPNAGAVDANYKDAAGFWAGWYLGIFSFLYNTDRFGKEMGGLKKPTTWDDLLDPAWKQKLIMPDPVKTGGGFIFLATQIFRFGRDEAKAMDFMKKLHGNLAQYTGSAPQAIQLVAQGQFVGAMNWAHDILTEKGKGSPIDLIVPQDTGFEVGAVSIIKGGPNTNAAKSFVNWILTKDAGALNVKLSNRVAVLKDVAPAPGAPTLDSVKLVNYDWQWAADNKERLLKAWQAAVGI
ncbi:MAG: ABC transporter substrate-binding protein [Chloroflexi bacterium]|nr:ABC transporter substrate-binding protein [Chloroflexota bacterium]